MWTRRDFLTTQCGGGLAAAAMPTLFRRAVEAAAPQGDRVLVVVYLQGGNDGLNTVAPVKDPLYARLRPTLAVRSANAVRLTDSAWLHPSLRDLGAVWNSGGLAVVQGVGYPNHSRSHFLSTAVWHAGRPGVEPRKNDGWLGRALDRLQPGIEVPLAYSVGQMETPEALCGRIARTASPPDVTPEEAAQFASALASSPTTSGGVHDDVERRRRDAVAALRRLASAKRTSSDGFPQTKLGRQLASVSWLIGERVGARAYYLEQPGYDTHSSQAQSHAELLRELGSSLAAFHRRNQQLGTSRNVTVMVFSEFGRRAAENESEGTDHGAAGPVLLLGGSVRGGVHGKGPDLEMLDQGDVAVTTDFRSVYSTLLQSVLGVPPSAVLPGNAPLLPLFAG